MAPDATDLEELFRDCFFATHQTLLLGGGAEPLYLPSQAPFERPHRVLYRADYFASALHEVAHWCLAGAARRRLEDYGYWYAPDGRSPDEQRAFERAESRPQAIEWIFSEACGFPFHLSADNLAAEMGPSASFERAVEAQKRLYLEGKLPPRAAVFRAALQARFCSRAPEPSRNASTLECRTPC